MTLPELLHRLTDRSNKNAVLVAAYHLIKYKRNETTTSAAVKKALVQAHYSRASSINVSDILAKSSPWLECSGSEGGQQLWRMTPSGEKHIVTLVGIVNEDAERDVAKLTALVDQLRDEDARQYLREALRCLRCDALRACVVFAWVGAVQIIRAWVMSRGPAAVTAAVKVHQQNIRDINIIDDLARLKESTLLLAAQELSIFDKNEKDILENYCLDLRNKCGHPGKYQPGEKKVSAFLEDLISIVFSKA